MATGRQDELARRLLAPLDRVEPVRLEPATRGRRRRRSLALAVALAVAAGGLAAATAGSFGGREHRCPAGHLTSARPSASCPASPARR